MVAYRGRLATQSLLHTLNHPTAAIEGGVAFPLAVGLPLQSAAIGARPAALPLLIFGFEQDDVAHIHVQKVGAYDGATP